MQGTTGMHKVIQSATKVHKCLQKNTNVAQEWTGCGANWPTCQYLFLRRRSWQTACSPAEAGRPRVLCARSLALCKGCVNVTCRDCNCVALACTEWCKASGNWRGKKHFLCLPSPRKSGAGHHGRGWNPGHAGGQVWGGAVGSAVAAGKNLPMMSG